jgi:hypothetical protein
MQPHGPGHYPDERPRLMDQARAQSCKRLTSCLVTAGPHWPISTFPAISQRLITRPLAIQAWFDPCLEYEDAKGDIHSIGAIEYRCEPYKIRSGPHLPGDLRDIYRPLSPAGKEVTVCTKRPQKGSPPVFSPLISMNSGLRDQARVLNIPTARAVSNQLPGRRGSIMAKLLAEVRASFLRNAAGERGQFKEQYANAVAALRTEQLQEIEASIADTARRMLGAAGRPGRHPACGQ